MSESAAHWQNTKGTAKQDQQLQHRSQQQKSVDSPEEGEWILNIDGNGFTGVKRPRRKVKAFFFSGIDEHVKAEQINCNIGGIMSNIIFLDKCLEDSDICAIQEHWLYPDSLNFLSSVHKDFVGWGRSGNDLNPNSICRRGMGGIAFLWRKDFDIAIDKLEDMGSDRIIVIKLQLGKQKNLFIISWPTPC